jgi:hypothetical protein
VVWSSCNAIASTETFPRIGFTIEILTSNHGGKRPGAGRPRGSKTRETLDKEAAREIVRQQITAELEPLIDAAIRVAMAVSYCFHREASTGRWRLITDERLMGRADTTPGDPNYLRIFTVDPSVRAFAELLDRALDKPRRQEREVKVGGELDIVARLAAARTRS